MDVATVNKETKQMFEELAAALESPDTEVRRTKVAELLNLPKPQDIPRPGQARNWGLREWSEWGKPYGIVEAPRTTHAYMLQHPVYTGVRVALSSTPGDRRSGLQLACDVRQDLIGEMDTHSVTLCIAMRDHSAQWLGLEPSAAMESLVAWVGETYGDPRKSEAASVHSDLKFRDCTSEEAIRASKRCINLLNKIESRCKLPWRAAIRKATRGVDDVAVERLYDLFKHDMPTYHQGALALATGLETILEAQDILDADEDEAKAKAKAEREAAKASGADDYAKVIDGFRREVAEQCTAMQKLSNQAASHLTAKAASIERLAAEFKFPTYPTARITELQAQVRDLEDKNITQAAELEALAAHNTQLSTDFAALQAEHHAALALVDTAASTGDWEARYRSLVDLCRAKLHTDNFMELAAGVHAVRVKLAEIAL